MRPDDEKADLSESSIPGEQVFENGGPAAPIFSGRMPEVSRNLRSLIFPIPTGSQPLLRSQPIRLFLGDPLSPSTESVVKLLIKQIAQPLFIGLRQLQDHAFL